jgi:hypothetical protein
MIFPEGKLAKPCIALQSSLVVLEGNPLDKPIYTHYL